MDTKESSKAAESAGEEDDKIKDGVGMQRKKPVSKLRSPSTSRGMAALEERFR
jgi:hypothetical protein